MEQGSGTVKTRNDIYNMGAVTGYGVSLQDTCLEGFDSLGLHQNYTSFAKLVRHRILIPTFGGSSPSGGARFLARKKTTLLYSCPEQSARLGLQSLRTSRSTGKNLYWVRLSVRTVAFQVAKTGSTPVLSTSFRIVTANNTHADGRQFHF